VELSKGSAKGKVYNYKHLNKKKRQLKNSLMMHLNVLEKQERGKPKINRWKEIINLRIIIDETEIKTFIKNQ
jgi:hypothetical protein